MAADEDSDKILDLWEKEETKICLQLMKALIYLNQNLVCSSYKISIYSKRLHTGQSKMLLTIDERGSKITRNSVFDWHLSPVGRQMAIKNSVSNDY